MKTSNYTVRVLEPENPDNYLTQSVADLDIKNQVISKKIYLGINDSPDNWKEITATEADEIVAKQKEAQN